MTTLRESIDTELVRLEQVYASKKDAFSSDLSVLSDRIAKLKQQKTGLEALLDSEVSECGAKVDEIVSQFGCDPE